MPIDIAAVRAATGVSTRSARILQRRNHPSKTVVFEKARYPGKGAAKNGLNLSRNTFLISASQKVRVGLSFERVHDDQT
jgi:hypothetical protein